MPRDRPPNKVEVDFSTIPLLYQTATLVLPSKRIIVDLETGQIQDYLVDNQVKIPTLNLVREFETYLKRRGRADSTIAGYHAVLAALAEFLPDWPPAVDELNAFFDRYRDKDYSPVTLAEYWSRVNTWFNWAKEHHYILVNPMNQVPQPHLPEIEARVIPPQDFVKAINVLREVSANARPRQRCLPYERAIRDLAILRFTYATGCRVGEVAGLRLRDLHLETSQAKVQAATSKSKKWRTVYFGRQAKTSLENWLEIRPHLTSDQLFVGTRGNG